MGMKVCSVAYAYKKSHPVLQDISFELLQGDVLCLLGPNGTGKTTLLRCLLGLFRIKGGAVFINNENITAMPARRRASLLAYVPQSSGITFPFEAQEVVLMGRTAFLRNGGAYSKNDYRAVESAMDQLAINHLHGKMFHELSGGERQMVLVARAIAQEAMFLVMDEPAANLDYSNQIKILQLVRQLARQNYGILMTTHQPDHAFMVGTRAALMRDGHIIRIGDPEEVVTGASLTDLYHTKVCVTAAEIPEEGVRSRVCIAVMK